MSNYAGIVLTKEFYYLLADDRVGIAKRETETKNNANVFRTKYNNSTTCMKQSIDQIVIHNRY